MAQGQAQGVQFQLARLITIRQTGCLAEDAKDGGETQRLIQPEGDSPKVTRHSAARELNPKLLEEGVRIIPAKGEQTINPRCE